MRRILHVFALLCIAAFAVAAETPADTLVVTGRSLEPGARLLPLSADTFSSVFERDGAALIRRGGGLAADLYLEGFKRGDLLATLDGERHHTACPNRMDAVVGRINVLDVDRVVLSAGGAGAQTGLFGRVDYRRAHPAEAFGVRGYYEGGFEAAESWEGGASVEVDGFRATARALRQEAWLDGDGRGFTDLYGYADAAAATLTEATVHQVRGEWDVAASLVVTRDVLFPYLLMDERENDLWTLSAARAGHRVYVNKADHVMDNGLRAGGGAMVTDAATTTLGAVGPGYEFYARWWDADNVVGPLTNHLMPDVRRLGASFGTRFGPTDGLHFALHGGVVTSRAADPAVLDFYREVNDAAARTTTSVPYSFALNARSGLLGGEWLGRFEVASEPPELEQLFIAVRKPMGKPHWVGNPGLDDPVRVTLREEYRRGGLRLAGHLSYVDGYVQLASRTVGTTNYQTFAGVDAYIASVTARFDHAWFSAGAAWTWGEQVDDHRPLAEMRPLTTDLALTPPPAGRLSGRLTWTHALEQTRVDPSQLELPTDAWDRLDLVVGVDLGPADLRIAVENLTDETYARHLSYARNPFAAGVRVNEPGRVIRVRTVFAL